MLVTYSSIHWSIEKSMLRMYWSSVGSIPCTGQVSERQLLWRNPPQIWSCLCYYNSATTGFRQTKEIRRRHLHKYVFGSLTNTHTDLVQIQLQHFDTFSPRKSKMLHMSPAAMMTARSLSAILTVLGHFLPFVAFTSISVRCNVLTLVVQTNNPGTLKETETKIFKFN